MQDRSSRRRVRPGSPSPGTNTPLRPFPGVRTTVQHGSYGLYRPVKRERDSTTRSEHISGSSGPERIRDLILPGGLHPTGYYQMHAVVGIRAVPPACRSPSTTRAMTACSVAALLYEAR